ncbi:heavy metal translocating P-type ATPase [Mycobacterium montefiorense]|uniref:Cobalt/nickel-exporting P-type ATPase n=1 Tax=Mycobacterium montefiorense TaxID=154654 RepID=A0AA37PLW8_9MYCO|nr:heavy metal translocating P-type ATPase [Mycobacterium montefiorense]GBG40039.1 putative cobalt/nickel-exporting P-type ATPase [Mycobacterium montefiorense]GKU33601.1 putative cobalt/nickel-exporting P-type ATPase [Mycobacterium montefiorense]GKU39539.1 putative cobalt/nickel-exporting P-type ATPase [Mycobacterium montefiorense]GKU43815.1 putative cobalt/nickel-exporting P-type ATPase [Mycobacterium montefiorense]GKU52693.1 putative cobalt/nickel-exporting P-type ATPase [Mycobacterium monte
MSSTTVQPTRTPLPGQPHVSGLWSIASIRWATVALVLFTAGLTAQLFDAPWWSWWVFYLACYATGGWTPAWEGLQALRSRTLDVDLLMVVAAIGAASIGQIFDGALLIVIFATSGALEDAATKRTEDSIKGLLDLAPDRAVRVDPDGIEVSVNGEDLCIGDLVSVRPGERVSADGVVVDGASDVDQSSVTGEHMPVGKSIDDEVFAGTLNGAGALRIRVIKNPSDTVVARIVALVAEASATKAKTQLFIEKVEQRYSVGVVVATLALFAVPLVFGAGLQSTLLRAMTFMIVASPCAVVLATMPPLLSAIANAGRQGVLVKSAVAMEHLADTTQVTIDKTGTLTTGTPQLTSIASIDDRYCDNDVLRIAASAEQFSEHPLGRAVVAAARARALRISEATEFRALPGRGVRARVAGQTVEVLSPRAFHSNPPAASSLESRGTTAVLVIVDAVPVGVLGLDDTVREGADAVVAAITATTSRPPALLTGDTRPAAEHLAAQVGIADVRADLLPDDKVAAVRQLQADGQRVLFVGDGINDAPAMAAAHSSIAMGRNGSDLTLEMADAVTVRDELSTIPAIVALSRRARRAVIVNLVIAATFITGLVIWDLVGHLPLPLGVAGHEGFTIVVALNGLRLLSGRAWRSAIS